VKNERRPREVFKIVHDEKHRSGKQERAPRREETGGTREPGSTSTREGNSMAPNLKKRAAGQGIEKISQQGGLRKRIGNAAQQVTGRGTRPGENAYRNELREGN